MSKFTELYRQIAQCQRCNLQKSRLKVVPGEGDENAKIMFIGEAPGWHENQQGRPFVGPAGQFLEELLRSIRLSRSEVYITNVVKCRPPGNRDPEEIEIEACRSYLDCQLTSIQPKMIVTLGRYSMARYFPDEKISRIHGRPRKIDGILYFPMYHPAAALHRGDLRSTIEEDMLKIPSLLAELEKIQDSAKPVIAEQLNLF